MSLTADDISEIRDCSFRAVNFIETYFPSPDDETKKVKLTNSQIDAIDSIQFGFSLRKYEFDEINRPPRGVVMVWPRQTGKSFACAYAACAFSIIYKHCSIGIISATDVQSKKLMRKIKRILKNSIFWDYVIHNTTRKDFIELTNGNFVECWPCTDAIEGSTYKFLFCDEAALMEEDILVKSALPTVTHGDRWIMLSTPKGAKGIFIEKYFDGLKTRPLICKNCSTEYPQSAFAPDDFPADEKEMPLEDMHDCVECGERDYRFGIGKFAVPHVDPWNDGIRTKEEITQLLDENDWSPEAKQEYLGKIISGGSSVFLRKWVEACTNGRLKNVKNRIKGASYIIGVDYGKKHDAASFYVTHAKRDKTFVVDFGLTMAGEFDYEKEYSHIRADLLKLIVYYNPVWVVPDATGLGDPLVEDLERDLRALRNNKIVIVEDLLGRETKIYPRRDLRTRIYHNKRKGRPDVSDPKSRSKGFIIDMSTKPGLIGNLIKVFRRTEIEIPPKTEPEVGKLREELLRFESEWKPGSTYIKYGTQSFHDDRVIALALSIWGHRRGAWNMDQIDIKGGAYAETKRGEYNFGLEGFSERSIYDRL